jgi:hypothetical protein
MKQADAQQSFAALYNTIKSPQAAAQLSIDCASDWQPTIVLMGQMHQTLTTMHASMNNIFNVTKCDRMVPYYTNTVYEGVCQVAPRAVLWVFCCALIVGLMGNIMATLRVAYKDIVVETIDKLPSDLPSDSAAIDDPINNVEDYAGDEMEGLVREDTDEEDVDNTYSSFYDDTLSADKSKESSRMSRKGKKKTKN